MLHKRPSALALWLSFVVLLGPTLCDDHPDQENEVLTQQVFSALNRVIDFYRRDFKSINLDGIFGLRVAQGAFLSIINDARDEQLYLDDHVVDQVKTLYNKAALVAQNALPYLQRSEPEYFSKFRKQVSYPWINFKPFTNKKLTKRQFSRQGRRNLISFDESTSDRCISELTGTGSKGSQPCQISDSCWRLISAEGAAEYTLTHQALYLLVGEIQGCTPILLKRLEQSHVKGGLEEFYNRICSDMYPQMTAVEEKRTLDRYAYKRDLYMEQAMVCGSIGYRDFLSSKRLRHILTWQRKDGCFGTKKQTSQSDSNDEEAGVSNAQSDLKQGNDEESMVEEHNSPFGDFRKSLGYEHSSKILRKPLSMRTMRSLLVEEELNDGCLSHLTGVAAGLLGVYLRWLLYPHEKQLNNQVKMEMKQYQDPQQISKEIYNSDNNIADIIAIKERQLQKSNQMPSEHLQKMRKAAMIENSEHQLLSGSREGSAFLPWSVVWLGSTVLVLSGILIKVFKGTLKNILIRTVVPGKKSKYVI